MILSIQPDRNAKLELIDLREDFREELMEVIARLLSEQPDSLRQISIAYDINEHHLGRIVRGQEANPKVVKLLKALMALRSGGQTFIVPNFAAKNLRIAIDDGGWGLPVHNTFTRSAVNEINASITAPNFPESEIYRLYDFQSVRLYLLTRFLFCAGWRMELAVGDQTALFNHAHHHPVNANPEKYYQEHEGDWPMQGNYANKEMADELNAASQRRDKTRNDQLQITTEHTMRKIYATTVDAANQFKVGTRVTFAEMAMQDIQAGDRWAIYEPFIDHYKENGQAFIEYADDAQYDVDDGLLWEDGWEQNERWMSATDELIDNGAKNHPSNEFLLVGGKRKYKPAKDLPDKAVRKLAEVQSWQPETGEAVFKIIANPDFEQIAKPSEFHISSSKLPEIHKSN